MLKPYKSWAFSTSTLDAVNAAAGTAITLRHAAERDGEWKYGALDSTRAARKLGWTATTPVEDGIRDTYRQLTA